MNPIPLTEDQITSRLAEGRSLRLPEQSRTRMRAELSSYADLHAVAAATPAPVAPSFSILSFLFSRRALASYMAVVLIIGIGTGTTYASEGALPGEALYAVKVNVLEPVQTALITDTKAKAGRHAALAERRLEEATTLAVAHKLDAKIGTKLKAAFSQHVESSLEDAQELAVAGDADAAAEAKSDLEAKVTAHAEILALVAESTELKEEEATSQVQLALADISAEVVTRKDALVAERIAMESADDTHAAVAIAEPELADPAAAEPADVQENPDLAFEPDADTSASIATTMMLETPEGDQPIAATMMAKSAPTMDPEEESRSRSREAQIEEILLKNEPILKAAGTGAAKAKIETATSTSSSTAATTTPATGLTAPEFPFPVDAVLQIR